MKLSKILLTGVAQFLPLCSWSASCATVDTNGIVVVTATPVGECTALILLSSEDWGGASVWLMPTAGEISSVWASAFILPMTLFLFAWSIGRIVHFFRS